MPTSLSLPQARRVALAAQGFADPPHARPTMRTFERTIARSGLLQVDSVNVLARAHLLPLYSRMGAYDVDLLRRASEQQPRRMVEYWAHVQAFMPVDLWPVMRHRMDHYLQRRSKWHQPVSLDAEREVLALVRDRGAVTARDLDDGAPRRKDHWGWNWSQARVALDFLFVTGRLAAAGRNSQFELRYDLPERVLPVEVVEAPALSREDAELELVRSAARSHGVATVHCLRDYYRLPYLADTQRAIDRLVAAGELSPVTVQGWSRPAYLHRDARLPRRVNARALLAPFDPVVWERDRAEALFDFFYRIEIYTPAAKRVHGYYVLPFLLGDRLVGRVDLKADRRSCRLLVRGAYAEGGAPDDTAEQLALELRRMAGWLGLDAVVVEGRGDLAPALAALTR